MLFHIQSCRSQFKGELAEGDAMDLIWKRPLIWITLVIVLIYSGLY